MPIVERLLASLLAVILIPFIWALLLVVGVLTLTIPVSTLFSQKATDTLLRDLRIRLKGE